MPRHSPRLTCWLVAAACAAAPTAAFAQSKSGGAAKEVAQLMTASKLDAFAARDPNQADHFVAALFLGTQLLVVSARYEAPSLLIEKIGQRNYRDVYVDLNSAYLPDTRAFVEDLGADGLKPRREGKTAPFDTFESGTTRVALDGEFRKNKVPEESYMKAYGSADEKYAQMLAVLLGGLKKTS